MTLVNNVSIKPGFKTIDVSALSKPRRHAFWEAKHDQVKTIAIWGLGNVAQYHADPLKNLIDVNFPNIKFVVFDRRPKEQNKANIEALRSRGIEIAEYHVVNDAFLNRLGKDINVDAAIIGAPTLAHLDIMRICAKKGIYVFDEKPLVLPWQLNDFHEMGSHEKKFIIAADFMRGSEALNFGVDASNGFFNEIGTAKGVYSRFVENQTLDELVEQFSTRAGLLKVKTSGGGIYLDMACHENIKLDTILKAIFQNKKGLSNAQVDSTFLADANGLNERLGNGLKDPHAEVYGSVSYSLGGIDIYSDAGKGLGPSPNANLNEWSFATHIHGSEGDLIISTGTIQRDPFIYIKKNDEETGKFYMGFKDKFGYGPAFEDFFALVFGDEDAMRFNRATWQESTFDSVANANRVYTMAGTIGHNGEPGDLSKMQYFEAGSFPKNARKIWIPPHYE